MTVSVICEECGKVYHVPIAKLDQIKGDVVKTKCKDCSHITIFRKRRKSTRKPRNMTAWKAFKMKNSMWTISMTRILTT